jgi:hypothetical protein
VKNWGFLVISIVFTGYILTSTGKLNDLLSQWQDKPLPDGDQLALWASQGFYYLTMLIGVIYLVKKFKNKHNKQD